MTSKEIKALIKMLRASGVNHYKNGDFEITLSPLEPKEPTSSRNNKKANVEEDDEIKHQVMELTSLLKLDDVSLVDRLFPDYTQENTEDGDGEESAFTTEAN